MNESALRYTCLLWWDYEAEKLSNNVMQIMQDDTTQVFLSQISIWEMQIKYQLGKLTLRLPLESVIEDSKKTITSRYYP